MMDGTWLPGVVVLALGILAGVILIRLLARRSRGAASDEPELEIQDLENRRDDLYRRLRELEPGEDAERERLETDAARVLKELDRLGAGARQEGAVATSRAPVAAPAGHARRSALVGFVFGGALVALIAILIYWAGSDATPRQEGSMAPPAQGSDDVHDGTDLPPEYAAMVRDLETKLEANPEDVVSRKTLAVLLLDLGQLLPAFQQAEILLAANPEDIDGLFIHGMVRLQMGQDAMASSLFERVLAQRPDHVRALLGTGAVALRAGDRAGAIRQWELALEATGGQDPEIRELISMAQVADAEGGAGEGAAVESAVAVPADPTGPVYRVRVELADPSATGAALFVTLRPAEGAPPAAVKRVMQPRFPMEVVLSQAESMMGQPLPESGLLTVRLDADGSASTRADSDLEARTQAVVGQSLVLTLGADG